MKANAVVGRLNKVHMDVKIGGENTEDEFQVLAHDWDPIDELFSRVSDLHLFVIVINHSDSSIADDQVVKAGLRDWIHSRLPRLYTSQRLDVVVNVASSVGVLSPGDIVGEGLELNGERIRRVADDEDVPKRDRSPSNSFEVIRRLGGGCFTSTYLVREIRYRDVYPCDHNVSDIVVPKGESSEYGDQYALKVLSKEDMDEDGLNVHEQEVCFS